MAPIGILYCELRIEKWNWSITVIFLQNNSFYMQVLLYTYQKYEIKANKMEIPRRQCEGMLTCSGKRWQSSFYSVVSWKNNRNISRPWQHIHESWIWVCQIEKYTKETRYAFSQLYKKAFYYESIYLRINVNWIFYTYYYVSAFNFVKIFLYCIVSNCCINLLISLLVSCL